ncbi:MAG: Cys-tRNA(Pro) deacylase [Actinomycetales bacterium]|nr:Cys-tRNA(Pro) deacylase [Actinomycetales bacterium]
MARKEAAGTPATLALTRARVSFTTHAYDHDPRSASFGVEAAEALGLTTDEVFKTLMALVDGNPVIAVVPVSGSLDLKGLAAAAGGRRAEMADPAVAERLTGYVVGGISPIGQKRALPTFVDETAELFDVIYVSGGRRGLDIGLAPADLLALTNGQYAAIGRS